jgi:hypothetical protein
MANEDRVSILETYYENRQEKKGGEFQAMHFGQYCRFLGQQHQHVLSRRRVLCVLFKSMSSVVVIGSASLPLLAQLVIILVKS